MTDKYGSCECFYGTAVRTADGGCACDNGIIGQPDYDPTGRNPINGGVRAGIDVKPIQQRPLGGGGGIRMKPSYFGGQTNDYYKYVDPRIYQTGGASQTGTTPTANTNTTGTTGTTTAAATISDQLANFYNQNKILVLAGVAGLGYMLMKKK
jgi:hypothetical protein